MNLFDRRIPQNLMVDHQFPIERWPLMSYFVILHGSFSGAVSLGVFDPGLQFWIKRQSGAL